MWIEHFFLFIHLVNVLLINLFSLFIYLCRTVSLIVPSDELDEPRWTWVKIFPCIFRFYYVDDINTDQWQVEKKAEEAAPANYRQKPYMAHYDDVSEGLASLIKLDKDIPIRVLDFVDILDSFKLWVRTVFWHHDTYGHKSADAMKATQPTRWNPTSKENANDLASVYGTFKGSVLYFGSEEEIDKAKKEQKKKKSKNVFM